MDNGRLKRNGHENFARKKNIEKLLWKIWFPDKIQGDYSKR